jgi:hypothetical protein
MIALLEKNVERKSALASTDNACATSALCLKLSSFSDGEPSIFPSCCC